MTNHTNQLGQEIGFPMENWVESKLPPRTEILGQYCRLEPLDIKLHGDDLYEAYGNNPEQGNWTYLPYGPFSNKIDFINWLQTASSGNDPLFHTVIDLNTDKAVGIATYLRINPKDGSIEVGHIHFSPLMQKTPLSTEAMFLMMRQVFNELGYRRYEWKCDSLNTPSKVAAQRLAKARDSF